MLTDPALLRQGTHRAARGSTTPRTSCCACARCCTSRRGRNQNILSHELQERIADLTGLSGQRAAAARRAPDERLLPPRAGGRPVASSGRARTAPRAGRAEPGAVARRHPLRRSRAGRADALRRGSAPSRPPSTRRHRRVGRGAVAASSSTSTATGPTTSFPTPRDRAALLRFLRPRAGLYARLSEMHDCGLLGRMFPEFQAISWRVVRDFYHKYTVDEHTLLTIRNLERLSHDRRARRGALPQRARRARVTRNCWCWRCCFTTSASGATTTTRSRACGWREGVLDRAPARRRGARDGALPDPPAPEDVARRLPARHRGSGDRPAVRGVRRHRGAASRCSA